MKPWESAHLSEFESLKGPGTLRWSPGRRRFGITAFGINAYTAAEAGQDVVEEHTETTLGHEELYTVVAGHATFTLGDEGDPERGLAEIEAGLAAKPDTPVLLYHLACLNSRLGRLDVARAALDRAIAGDPKFAKWAEDDEDLVPLRVAGES